MNNSNPLTDSNYENGWRCFDDRQILYFHSIIYPNRKNEQSIILLTMLYTIWFSNL